VNSPTNDFFYPVAGISGFVDYSRIWLLVGVFVDDTEPTNPAPPSLDFSDNAIGHSFTSLAPQLRQVFFIGDGLTGTGSGNSQIFAVPPTATRFYLGLTDIYYNDNSGSFTTIFGISSLPQIPTPAIAAVRFLTNETIQLQVSGLAGRSYILQASTNLSNWISLVTNRPVAAPFYLTDPAAANFPYRFYRIIQQP
jgi:hypothetical protein